MYSAIVNKQVLDYKFKPLGVCPKAYFFYVGDILLGQVFWFKTGWKAVSTHTPCDLGVVSGFKTRYDASTFILQVCKIEDFYKGQTI